MTTAAAAPVRRTRPGVVLAGAVVVAVLVVLVLACVDTARARSHADLAHVSFGTPLAWISQDQSASDPPLPATARPTSPQENPTSVRVLPLLADLVLMTAVLAGAGLVVSRQRSRRADLD